MKRYRVRVSTVVVVEADDVETAKDHAFSQAMDSADGHTLLRWDCEATVEGDARPEGIMDIEDILQVSGVQGR